MLTAGSVVVFVSVNADLTRGDANFMRIRDQRRVEQA